MVAGLPQRRDSVTRWIRYGGLGLFGVGLLVGLGYTGMVVSRWTDFRAEDCRVTPLMYHGVVPDQRQAARYRVRESDFRLQMDSLKAAGAVTPSPDSVVAWLQRPGGCLSLPAEGRAHHLRSRRGIAARRAGAAAPPAERLPGHLLRAGCLAGSSARRFLGGGAGACGRRDDHRLAYRAPPRHAIRAAGLDGRAVCSGPGRGSAPLSGQPIAFVSAPGGRYDEAVVAGVERAGFTGFFTSDPCYLSRDTNPEKLCRIEIRGDEGMTALDAMRSPWGRRRTGHRLGP